MQVKHIKKSELNTTNWSGGTTTQLYIYPETANYQKRDFLFRLSTATVELEESNFTSLPGVERLLLILEGQLDIEHKGQYLKHLNTYETDRFMGDWETSSKGKVTDFNLMLRENTKGEIQVLKFLQNETQTKLSTSLFHVFYLKSGKAKLKIKRKTYNLDSFDILILEKKSNFTDIQIMAMEDSILVESRINI